MKKYEKEIFDNINLDAPDKSILDRAKSSMPEKRIRKLNSRQIFAIVSSCITVLVVLICIPFMNPASNDMPVIKTDELQSVQIQSIAENYPPLFSFGSNYLTTEYLYNNTTVFIEEFSKINNTNVVLLVRFKDNYDNLLFQKQEDYSAFLTNAHELQLLDKKILWFKVNEKIYLYFSNQNFDYYAVLSDDINDWVNFLKDFLI